MSIGQIYWNDEKQKYLLLSNGTVLVASKNKDYLNYLVVKQKHPAIIAAKVTMIEVVKDKEEGATQEVLSADKDNKPHVSALIFESVLGVPFQVKEVTKTVKVRGRPRKQQPDQVGFTTVKISDEETDNRQLLPDTIDKLRADYREYVEEGLKPLKALEEVAKLYRVPYNQAFNLCADEL